MVKKVCLPNVYSGKLLDTFCAVTLAVEKWIAALKLRVFGLVLPNSL